MTNPNVSNADDEVVEEKRWGSPLPPRTFEMDATRASTAGTVTTRVGIAGDVPPVHVALARVARQVLPVGKGGKADPAMGGYSFRKYDDIVDAIHDAMAAEGVIPFYEMLAEPVHHPWSNKMHRLVVPVKFRFIGPAGDELVTTVWCEALDNADKGIGKAISYGLKDLLTRMLTLPFGPAADNEAPVAAAYDDGYERTYDANTIDPPSGQPTLITDEERRAINRRIDRLDEDQTATLKERWGKLTKANALPPLMLLRPHDLPVVEDLLKNVEAPPNSEAADTAAAVNTVEEVAAKLAEMEAQVSAAIERDTDETDGRPGKGEACVICGSTRSKLVSVAGQWRCERASACADRVAAQPGGYADVVPGPALAAPSAEALATAAKFDCPHGDDGCVAPETCNEWDACAEKPA